MKFLFKSVSGMGAISSLRLLLNLLDSFRALRGCKVPKCLFDLFLSNLKKPVHREEDFESLWSSNSEVLAFEETVSSDSKVLK